MKRFVFMILIIVVTTGLTGCDTILPYGRKYNIFSQQNTDWISEDETMSIHIGENGAGTLTVYLDGQENEYLLLCRYAIIFAYDVIDEYEADEVEAWHTFYHRDWFSAKVYWSNYFEEGTKIKFYRIDE